MTDLNDTLAMLRAAAETTRLRILALCGEAELTVSELQRILGQSQPRISRHLKVLAEAGLLTRSPEGSAVFHRLAHDGDAAEVARSIVGLLPGDDDQLERDRAQLDRIKAERARAAAAYFRKNAKRWDELRSMQVDARRVEKAILDALPKHGIHRLLDIGTGTGRILEVLADRVERGYGIDTSREMLTLARANLEKAGARNCEVRQADLYQIPFPGECFDAVTIHQVLHYLPDPAGAVEEAARVLKPGGRLVIVDFAPHDVEALRAEHQHRRLGFSDAEVKEWIRASGLEPRRVDHLKGKPLTVTVWLAERPAAADRVAPSAMRSETAARRAS